MLVPAFFAPDSSDPARPSVNQRVTGVMLREVPSVINWCSAVPAVPPLDSGTLFCAPSPLSVARPETDPAAPPLAPAPAPAPSPSTAAAASPVLAKHCFAWA